MRKFILILVFLFAIVALAITVSADEDLGYTGASDGDFGMSEDYWGTEDTAGQDGTVTTGYTKLKGWSAGEHVRMIVYYDNSGTWNLLGESNTLSTGCVDGTWVEFTFSPALSITNGETYVIGANSGTGETVSVFYKNSGSNELHRYGSSFDWDESPPDPISFNFNYPGYEGCFYLEVEDVASNNAPTQTNASPNGSSIHTVDNFTVDLSDGDDDSLTWQMWTNYSGTWTMFDNGTGNGTQTSTNTSWLPCEGTVYWSVNVTDGTEWVNTTYNFTITNDPPTFSNLNPADGSTTTGLNCSIKLTIEDPDGDTFSYNWSCSDGSYNLATGNTNGTKYLMLCMEGIHTCGTTYTWWINASDGCEYTNNSYSFTTRPCVMNYSDIHPSNASSNICPCTLCNNNTCVCINATHETGNNVNISFYSNYSGTWQLFENYSNVSGRYCAFFPASYNTTYWWYVNVTEFNNESSYNQTDVYHFTTAENYSNCTCSASSGEIIFTDIDNAYILTIILIVGGLGIIFADTRRKRGK